MSNYNRNGGIDPNDIASLVQNVVNSVAGAIGTAANDVASSLGKNKDFFRDIHLNTDGYSAKTDNHFEETENSNKANDKNTEYSGKKTFAKIKRHGMHPALKYAIAAVLAFGAVTTFTAGISTSYALVISVVSAMLFAGGVGFAAGGLYSDNTYRLAGRYRRLCVSEAAVSFSELAERIDKKPRKVQKELSALVDAGYFGTDAYIDLGGGMFVLDPAAFAEEQKIHDKKANEENKSAESREPPDEYDRWLFRIAEANRKIADPGVSRRADAIGMYTARIFEYVKTHNEAESQIRTFMNYYLPLTLKLLQSYEMIEDAGVAGDNMRVTKENIESTLDTLRGAYRKELDTLYTSEALDISSDIDVLDAMLKRDGLDNDEGSAAGEE